MANWDKESKIHSTKDTNGLQSTRRETFEIKNLSFMKFSKFMD